MHILAGRYKGRSIKTISSSSYRPTQSRIRKSLFDILGPLDGISFLDLYAGSGIIGFEAASRGAIDVTFVENNYITIKLLHKNIQKFDEGIFFAQKQNALNYLKSCGEYDIIFADPPYGCNELPELVKLGLEHIKDFGTFILESRTGDELPESTDNRTYGDTQLNLWKK